MKFCEIYSHHLYKVEKLNYWDEKKYDITFFSQNCFSIKRKEDNKYLTAFRDGRVDFFADKCAGWEKFYILDKETLYFISESKKRNYKNELGEIISDYQLSIENLQLQVTIGSRKFTPSFIPKAELKIEKHYIEYKTVKERIKSSLRRPLILFVIYGKDEYYECFFLALKSLIEIGKYQGDILIRTDNIKKVEDFCSGFNNTIYYSEIDKQLGMYNKYLSHEQCLKNHNSIIYFDSDILTINPVNNYIEKLMNSGQFAAYQEGDMKLLEHHLTEKTDRKDFANKFRWFGFNNIFPTEYINEYFLLNAGFFVVNDLVAVNPIFKDVINYRYFEGYCGDQPFFNAALYNRNLNIVKLKRGDGLEFSKNQSQTNNNLDKVLIHFNSGVGNVSKLNLMKEAYEIVINCRRSDLI